MQAHHAVDEKSYTRHLPVSKLLQSVLAPMKGIRTSSKLSPSTGFGRVTWCDLKGKRAGTWKGSVVARTRLQGWQVARGPQIRAAIGWVSAPSCKQKAQAWAPQRRNKQGPHGAATSMDPTRLKQAGACRRLACTEQKGPRSSSRDESHAGAPYTFAADGRLSWARHAVGWRRRSP